MMFKSVPASKSSKFAISSSSSSPPLPSSCTSSLYLKYGALILITLQTTVLVLTLRYSRKQSSPNESYFNSTAIFISEILKFLCCCFVLIVQNSFSGFIHAVQKEILYKPKESLKIAVPSFLYTIQNNLLFLALTNLDAATYQVTYQFKIIITALFSKWLLRKDLSLKQWFALFLLMFGVIMVQWPNEKNMVHSSPSHQRNESKLIGLVAIILSSFTSGFSGVYFEKLLKSSKSQSLWIKNIQLTTFCCFFSFFLILMNDYKNILTKGFFFGYNQVTYLVIILQALGGICVSLVVKYADNILKGFATTISIILSTIFSICFFEDFLPTASFYLGTLLVIVSTFLYSL
ncbi:Eukaryotic translation initiation factor 2 [Sarcoptes scabiei]|nr:Eukaryotic translation initiation factor 2 [Sarcoptes scabiei]